MLILNFNISINLTLMEIGNRIVLILALIVCGLAAQEPTGIVMLFRHGARGPNGPNVDNTWENMYGELTPVGMRQQYLRRAYLSKIYPNLSPSMIQIQSTFTPP